MKVRDIPENAVFLSDSQDVRAVRRHLGKNVDKYDAYFVVIGDGDYKAVWGMYGIVPYDDKEVFRLL